MQFVFPQRGIKKMALQTYLWVIYTRCYRIFLNEIPMYTGHRSTLSDAALSKQGWQPCLRTLRTAHDGMNTRGFNPMALHGLKHLNFI